MILQWVLPESLPQVLAEATPFLQTSLEQLQKAIDYVQPDEVFIWGWIPEAVTTHTQTRLETMYEDYFSEKLQVSVDVFSIREANSLDQALLRVDQSLHWVCLQYPLQTFALVPQPNMSLLYQAVLVESIKTFEDRFISLISDEQGQFVYHRYEEQLTTEDDFHMFQQVIHEYDYQTALQIVPTNLKFDHVRALLQMQLARFNFDFEQALHVLETQDVKLEPLTKLQTTLIFSKLTSEEEQVKDLATIEELYRHIKALLFKEDYASFLIRFYRAREAVLSYILKYGAEQETFHKSSIYELVAHIEDLYEADVISEYHGAYFYTKSANVASTLHERNKSFIGHRRRPIYTKFIAEAYYGVKTPKNQMKTRFLGDTRIMLKNLGGHLDDHFEQMNEQIITAMMAIVRGKVT